MNEYNKLEFYTPQGCKGLPGANSLAYWAHSYVTKKIKLKFTCWSHFAHPF
jgi:hypothetical protein